MQLIGLGNSYTYGHKGSTVRPVHAHQLHVDANLRYVLCTSKCVQMCYMPPLNKRRKPTPVYNPKTERELIRES